MGETAVHEQKECEAAKTALNEFNNQLIEMNSEIDRTFEVQKQANRALQEAEEELGELEDGLADQETVVDELNEKLDKAVETEEGTKKVLTELVNAEPKIRQDVKDAIEALGNANKLINDGVA